MSFSPSRFTLVAWLCLSCACSTALLPYAVEDDGEDDDAAPRPVSTQHPDAGPIPLDATRPISGREAGVLDASAREAGVIVGFDPRVNEASVVEAGPSAPSDAGPRPGDAGVSACVPNNAPTCPTLRPATSASCALGASANACAYPVPNDPIHLDELRCVPGAMGSVWAATRVQCRHDCFAEIPRAFEEVHTNDCASRPIIPCDEGFANDQRAVDDTLAGIAQDCGMLQYHLGLIFSREGCARALFIRETTSPAVPCIGERLAKLRFGCAPLCAVATADLLQ